MSQSDFTLAIRNFSNQPNYRILENNVLISHKDLYIWNWASVFWIPNFLLFNSIMDLTLIVVTFFRYSDIIAHRLLAVSIGADSSYADLLDKSKIQKVCNNLNFRHKMAQYAGRASVNLHTHVSVLLVFLYQQRNNKIFWGLPLLPKMIFWKTTE